MRVVSVSIIAILSYVSDSFIQLARGYTSVNLRIYRREIQVTIPKY
jgi:hypothetical protein